MKNYRLRIYNNYVSSFKNANSIDFDKVLASRIGKAYDYYFRGWLPENKMATIADLACGDGKLMYFFMQRGYICLQGVDISEEQIKIAQKISGNVLKNDVISYINAHNDKYNLITGLDIIEHFDKDEVLQFLDGCYRSLQQNGRLILQTPNAESPWGLSLRYGDFTHEVAFSPQLLTKLLKFAGFDQIIIREQGPIPWGYSLSSTIRYIIWHIIKCMLIIWNVVETGSIGSGVFTRVFLISAVKK